MKQPLTARAALVLCALGVAVCAAAPAVFLRGADALYLAHPQTVADPYTAPVPNGDDYYVLRQLQARQQTEKPTDDTAQENGRVKLYLSAGSSLREMDSNASYKADVTDALQGLVDCGALPQAWADAALNWGDTESDYYESYDTSYWLDTVYYSFDSVGIVTFRRYAMYSGQLRTAFSLTMDSRTGQVLSVWISTASAGDATYTKTPTLQGAAPSDLPEATTENLQAFVAQAGLTSLGDWTERDDLTYTNALYSANGQALAATDRKDYQLESSTLPYFSMSITLCAEDNLPRRLH